MAVPYRNSLVFAFLCIGFIAFTTVVKIHQTIPRNPAIVKVWSPSMERPPLRPSTSFFNVSTSTATIMTAANEGNRSESIVPTLPRTGLARVTARAYIAGNVETGEIYLERSPSVALPVASMSKLVTAFVATNELELDKVIEINAEAAAAPPDKSLLREGERFTVSELLEPLLLSSSNVAAEALLSNIDRAEFLELMSSYSWEIGMPATFFADPSGVSPQNMASARDLFALAKYLYNSRPDILSITRTVGTETSTTTEHGSHVFMSTHPFADDPRFIGGKTGRTPQAGDTMLTILRIKNQPIAIVVLGSQYEGRAGDTKLLAEKVESMLEAQ